MANCQVSAGLAISQGRGQAGGPAPGRPIVPDRDSCNLLTLVATMIMSRVQAL